MINKYNEEELLSRSRLLLGTDLLSLLGSTRVILFGVGGVGSWCAEALVRTGVGHLCIVDSDVVCPSNVNRQLMATTATLGRPKVEALRERLLQIRPGAHIEARQEVYSADTAHLFPLDDYDYVVDAIDSLRDKALLILSATRSRARLFSSMGAALKLDPKHIHVGEFWQVKGCPLARALRQRFKREKTFPARKFQCVYSDELLRNEGPQPDPNERVNGSLVHITGIFGFTLAGLVMEDLRLRNKG